MAVELRLDTADWEKFAGDHYVSVRVGECQKLSKIAASRTYKFPASAVGSRRYGRVEIFRRVGAGAVCIDPQVASGVNEVSVNFEGAMVNFDVHLNSDSKENTAPVAEKAKAFPEAEKPSRAEKAQAKAKEYLEEHHLEVRLSEAMQAVLRERPADPAAFLAQRLMENAEVVAKLPQKAAAKVEEPQKAAKSPEPKAEQVEPAPAAAKTGPKVSLKPFGEYYTKNINAASMAPAFQSLYGKFGQKAAKAASAPKEAAKKPQATSLKPFAAYYAANILPTTNYEGLHKRFAAYRDRAPKAKKPEPLAIVPFKGYYEKTVLPTASYESIHQRFPAYRASLAKKQPKLDLKKDFKGYYNLTVLPTALPKAMVSIYMRFKPYQEALAKGAPAALPAAAEPEAFGAKPSVGTWLTPLRRGPAVATAAVAAAPANAGAAKVNAMLKPSVGTWIMPLPKGASAAAVAEPQIAPAETFAEKPSVGSWLAPLRKSPQQAAGLVDSAPAPAAAPAPAKAAPAVAVAAPTVAASYPLPQGQQTYLAFRNNMYGPNFYGMGMSQGLVFF